MNKLIINLIMTFMFFIIIWLIVGYIQHGDDIFSMHLDIYSTFKGFVESKVNSTNLDEFFNKFRNFVENLPSWYRWWFWIIEKSLYLFTEFVLAIIDIFTLIKTFIFNPVFI